MNTKQRRDQAGTTCWVGFLQHQPIELTFPLAGFAVVHLLATHLPAGLGCILCTQLGVPAKDGNQATKPSFVLIALGCLLCVAVYHSSIETGYSGFKNIYLLCL